MSDSAHAPRGQTPPSFGAWLFPGFQPADDYATPDDHAPATWQDTFMALAGPGVRLLVFKSCRAGRDWVLRDSPKAKLSISAAHKLNKHKWAQLYDAARQALITRGTAETELVVTGWGDETADIWANYDGLASLLTADVSFGITCFTLCSKDNWYDGFLNTSSWMERVVCPNLRRLVLLCPTCPPPPENLPKLTHMVVAQDPDQRCENDTLAESIGPYLPQLTHLTFPDMINEMDGSFCWPLVFTRVSHTLTHLTVGDYGELTDELVQLLLSYAPAVTDLTVCGLNFDNEYEGGQVWAVERLVNEGHTDTWCLSHLPTNKAGKLSVTTTRPITVPVYEEGMDAALCDRFDEFTFTVPRLVLSCDQALPHTHHSLALSCALRQLRTLQATQRGGAADTPVCVELRFPEWTDSMRECVEAARPVLGHVTLELVTAQPPTQVPVPQMGPWPVHQFLSLIYPHMQQQ